jgi:hypothetical protein
MHVTREFAGNRATMDLEIALTKSQQGFSKCRYKRPIRMPIDPRHGEDEFIQHLSFSSLRQTKRRPGLWPYPTLQLT